MGMKWRFVLRVAYGLGIALALALPHLGLKAYYMHMAIIILVYVLLGSSLNLITGYAGQLSLAHAAFFGIGAYTSALLPLRVGWSAWAAMPVAGLLAGIAGVFLGIPTLRLKGPYLVIATLSFGEIVRQTEVNWISLTRGPMGLTGIPGLDPIRVPGVGMLAFSDKASYYYLLLVVVTGLCYLMRNLAQSRTGRAWMAIREDQVAAEVGGINLAFYKVLAFALGATVAGIAGSLYVHYVGFVSPDSFTISESIHILTMVAVGGMGTVAGPVVGAAVITYLLESLRALSEYRLILYGILLFLVSVAFPGGIVGEVARLLARAREGDQKRVLEGNMS